MAELLVTATITRDELSLADLQLNDGDTYKIAGHNLDIGRVTRRREVAKSVFTHGGIEFASVLDMTTLSIGFDVFGSSLSQVRTNMNALIDAFSQKNYTVGLSIEGASFSYACNAADYESSLTTQRMAARRGLIVFECPRQPGTEV